MAQQARAPTSGMATSGPDNAASRTFMSALVTSRLVLNDLALDDAFDLFALRGDAEAMAYWDWPADPNAGVTRMLVTGMLQEVSEGHSKSADLGFMLMRRYRGQGLAQEAVTAVLAYAQQLAAVRRSDWAK